MFASSQWIFDHLITPYIFSPRGEAHDRWFLFVSDLSIAAAHYAIVLVLLQAVSKRKERLFVRVIALFAIYIGMRGTTQLLGVWMIWHPQYQLGDLLRAFTTFLSVTTAVVLVRVLPAMHRIPSAKDLERETAERRKVETDLRIREERFRTILESLQDYAICQLDLDGMIRSWNAGSARILGYQEEEILGKYYGRFFIPEDVEHDTLQEALRLVKETGKHEAEGWRLRKDGSRFWAHVLMRPTHDAGGAITGFVKITRDLTESREMEARYQALLESAPDAIMITDSQGSIQFANAQVEKLYGYTRDEVLGQSMEILTPERLRELYSARGREYFRAPDVQHVPSPRDLAAGVEMQALRKDGSEFAFEMSISPVETNEGVLAMLSIRDITERKLAESRFRGLLESAPDAMVIVDGEGLIELSNAQTESLFGYPSSELIGKPVELLAPLSLQVSHREHRKLFFASPKKREMGAGIDLMGRRKDGSLFPVEISLSPLDGPDGISVTAAIRDVTESRKWAQQLAQKVEELRHSNEELEQFAYIASHDLQEPLRMVASYCQLLSKRYRGKLDADADEFIAYAVDGTKRMKGLIEDLLAYSRVGKGGLPEREFPSGEALKAALANLRTSIQESGAEIAFDPDRLPTVVASDAQLAQIFQNLVGNAIKYRGDMAPRIRIEAETNETEWVFSVSDNGIGIAPEHFERIFIIFKRLHPREEYEGTGVGLAICKRILQQRGGRIWVDSEPGRGSAFHFALPRR
jgi:PAS domain S-box-containing protein